MLKDSDKKAAALKAERTGGKLPGLLADEKEFDRRTLWRIGWWGSAAIGTVIVAVLANQGAQSWRRDRISAADLARQAQLLQSLARDSQNQARQLSAAIETLNNDRDRLYARVTVLEQSLDSVTGTLGKNSGKPQTLAAPGSPQSSAPVATADPQGPAPGQSPQAAATSAAVAGAAAPSAGSTATALAPVATATASDKARADADKAGGAAATASTWQTQFASTFSAMAAAPNPPSKMMEADKEAKVEISPESRPGPKGDSRADYKSDYKSDGATLEANAGTTEPREAALAPVQKTEFAVDLGTANSINGLRALWRGLAKSNRDLAALGPIIMIKESNTGMQLRLGAGPLTDAAAAAKICATLAERQRACETTIYDGQRLAMRDTEAGSEPKLPAASGPKAAPGSEGANGTPPNVPRRHVGQPQRHGAVVREPQPAPPPPPAAAPPAEPPKPEPNTLSSLFHRSPTPPQ